MEWVILHTVSAAGMAILGALLARGWPQRGAGIQPHALRRAERTPPPDDAFAKDLAAMLGYTGEQEEDENEA